MKKKRIIMVLILASSLLGVVVAVTAAAAPEATINVDSTADTLVAGDNECTLREAINNANTDSDTTGGDCTAGSGPDVIILPAGTYTLTIPGAVENNNATGDLDVVDDLTIDGAGRDITRVDGNGLDRVLHLIGPQVMTVNDLTISGGYLTGAGGEEGGAGIFNEGGDLTVTDSTVRNNEIVGFAAGGGILNNDGQAHLENTIVMENRVIGGPTVGGGGITTSSFSAEASLTLLNSQVISNTAPGGGGIINGSGDLLTSTLTILSSTIAYNQAGAVAGTTGSGGGIWNSYFLGTTGGATVVYILDSLINDNIVDGGSGGGGLYSEPQPGGTSFITIRRSTLRGNQALGNAQFTANGGGAFLIGADILIDSSTIVSNTASGTTDFSGEGGGIFLLDSTSTVVNSTISGNSAVGNPAAQASGNSGGVIAGSQSGPSGTTFINTTVANNSANVVGGGLGIGSLGPTTTFSFVNTIFAGNMAPTDPNCTELALGGPPVSWISLGHNLEDDDTCHFDQPSDQINTDPLLGPLQDNGGPTWTHALLNFSPAIDAGDDAVCAAAPVNGVDQRGVVRPIGSHCDIGAFESAAMPPIPQFDIYLPVVLKP